jgi:hypothetical protein
MPGLVHDRTLRRTRDGRAGGVVGVQQQTYTCRAVDGPLNNIRDVHDSDGQIVAAPKSRNGLDTESMFIRVSRQPFLDVFRFAFPNGLGALPALIAAHRFLAASAIAFLPAALILRFRALGAGAENFGADAFLPGGRPRFFAGPCSA